MLQLLVLATRLCPCTSNTQNCSVSTVVLQVSPSMCAEELTNQVLYMRNVPAGEKDVWLTFEAIEDGELGEGTGSMLTRLWDCKMSHFQLVPDRKLRTEIKKQEQSMRLLCKIGHFHNFNVFESLSNSENRVGRKCRYLMELLSTVCRCTPYCNIDCIYKHIPDIYQHNTTGYWGFLKESD